MDNNTTFATTIFAYIKDGATIEEITNMLIVYAIQLAGRNVTATEVSIEREQARLNEFLRTPHNSFNGLVDEFIFNYPLTDNGFVFMQRV
jgi:hypothetical protein